MHYISSLEAAEKHISAKIFKENLLTSVKILQICMVLQDSGQRSCRTLQKNPAYLQRFAKIENLGYYSCRYLLQIVGLGGLVSHSCL